MIDNQTTEPLEWIASDTATLQEMLEHCRNASPYTQTFGIDEREGYNGVKLFSKEEEYSAFMGKLTHRSGGKTDIRTDLGRKLEKLVLTHAPEPFRKKALAVLTIDFD